MSRVVRSTGVVVGVLAVWLCTACGTGSVATIEEIRDLQEGGRFDDTLEPLRAMLDEDPNQPEVNFLFGRALLRVGEPGLAVWSLTRASEFPEFASEAKLLLAQVLIESRGPRDALAVLDEVIESEPENVEARILRAKTYLRAARAEDALAELDRIEEMDPGNLDMIVQRAAALLTVKNFEEVEALLADARAIFAGPEGEARPDLAAGFCAVSAAFAFEQSHEESADAQFTGCLEEFPNNSMIVESALSFYDSTKNPDRAMEILQQAYDEEPGRFRHALIARMDARGDIDEVERLMLEWTEERPSPGSWFALGNFYTNQENYEAARNAFEQALGLTRTPSPMLVFAHGDTLIQLEEYDGALRVANSMDAGGGAYGDLLRGRIRLAQGDPKGAMEAFDAGIRLWPNNATARLLAAQAAEQLGDFPRAISEYRESVRSDASHTSAALELARLLEAMGNYSPAFDAVGRYVRSELSDPEGYVLTVRLANRLGRQDVVAEGLRRLARIEGQRARAVALESDLVAGSRGYEVAVSMIERANLDLTDPANLLALEAWVDKLGKSGRAAEALPRVDAAIAAHPDQSAFHALRARALVGSDGSPEEIDAAYARALELDAENASALAGQGRRMEDAGNLEAALALYDRAADADPENVAYPEAAARVLFASGDTSEAEGRLEAMLVSYPRDPRAAIELARSLLARGGDADRALSLAQRAVLLQSGAEGLEALGWAYLELGQHEDARDVLIRALEIDSGSLAARYRLGLALSHTGDLDGARDAFSTVLEDADAPEAPLARAELARLEGS